MALVRILVDGYSLLHGWPELAPGRARHSPGARAELIRMVTQYHDACGVPVTIFFDGTSGLASAEEPPSTPQVEILYSHAGQTADQMIERAAHRLAAYGEVLVVTDDHAERDTVEASGAITSSCLNFISAVDAALRDMKSQLKKYNQSERTRYQRSK